jgi:competence ComEA-like helix-hairpin-helix protein
MFTDSEKRVIIFIIVVLLLGSIIRYLYPEDIRTEEPISPFPININTANKDELILLPGIGEVYAERIISFREEFGKFKKKEDLMKVKGIGVIKFKNIEDKIIIEEIGKDKTIGNNLK